ncbi:MAG: tRNA uridine-5-carboxymethylaminomethyl(34) synthesis GTPase MnmE [Cytophagales bacterium]|nr:tRNA uridine-5-carboxymethylaminomethyl(34) synthesis GTPase MnmE [Cytophagales bacterium]
MRLSNSFHDTIVALATPPGVGAIGVIRVSGKSTITLVNDIFYGQDLTTCTSHTISYGTIRTEKETILDEVLVSLFKAPASYTTEDVIEISTHGSSYIIQKVIELLISKGARLAKPGEFTQRAFINGRFDLAQAEAVADLIASENLSMQQTAMKQMRGGFSDEISELRERLVHFASMIELELDFSEEDVEFADRKDLEKLVNEILDTLTPLIDSFSWGNVIKKGVPVVITGKPNAGKSTLLNALLKEEKAIVSSIPGTTRDFIEDNLILEGIRFRFIDTAGLRETTDEIEAIGVKRTKEQMVKASLVLYLFDGNTETIGQLVEVRNELVEAQTPFLLVGTKIDIGILEEYEHYEIPIIWISAAKNELSELTKRLVAIGKQNEVSRDQTIVTNTRHFESLTRTSQALSKVLTAISENVTGDFLAQDIREALHHLGEITGQVTTDDLLDNIFSKFCIGK